MAFVVFVFWLWRDSMNAREQAICAARRACDEINVQLLDETVSISKVRLCRTSAGIMALCRLYSFDFSLDGEVRLCGSISMKGQAIQDIVLDIENNTVLH